MAKAHYMGLSHLNREKVSINIVSIKNYELSIKLKTLSALNRRKGKDQVIN
jgi:hypothetical protein